jgi:ribulose-5-phosphate 4-epimerase/fuculose-1-phosphate aldolase
METDAILNRTSMPLCPKLSPEAELAVLTRTVHRLGYRDHTFGHITYKQPDGTFLVTPFELAWDEVGPADVMRMDADGTTIGGRWTITPAIVLHTEQHKARPDVTVAVHNHPPYGTAYSAARRIPPAYDQTSALAATDEIVLYDDYVGQVSALDAARANVAAVGDKNYALLANHGVFVLGRSIANAYFRCSAFEWRCRLAWRVESMGGGVPMPEVQQRVFVDFLNDIGEVPPNVWEAEVRRELRNDPGAFEGWFKAN